MSDLSLEHIRVGKEQTHGPTRAQAIARWTEINEVEPTGRNLEVIMRRDNYMGCELERVAHPPGWVLRGEIRHYAEQFRKAEAMVRALDECATTPCFCEGDPPGCPPDQDCPDCGGQPYERRRGLETL